MILEVCWEDLWALSFGLSQLRGQGSWLVCEVGLIKLQMDWYEVQDSEETLQFYKEITTERSHHGSSWTWKH